jgi:hypothetical protein
LSGLSGNELSTKLLLFALTNRVYSEASLMDTSPNMHDRTQVIKQMIYFNAAIIGFCQQRSFLCGSYKNAPSSQ